MRYLGHAGQEVAPELEERIAAGIALAERTCEPRWLWRVFEVVDAAGAAALPQSGKAAIACVPDDAPRAGTAPDAPAVRLAGTSLELPGRDIADFLCGAVRVALLACTLGAPADRELRRLGLADPLGQLVFDAACTDLVEWGADQACAEIAAEAASLGLKMGEQFSPGYGDLPIDVQPDFLDVLHAGKRLGLTASASSLLVPTKSVTCIVGLYPAEPPAGMHLGCGACNIWANCQLRLRSTPCWKRAARDDVPDTPLHEHAAPVGSSPGSPA